MSVSVYIPLHLPNRYHLCRFYPVEQEDRTYHHHHHALDRLVEIPVGVHSTAERRRKFLAFSFNGMIQIWLDARIQTASIQLNPATLYAILPIDGMQILTRNILCVIITVTLAITLELKSFDYLWNICIVLHLVSDPWRFGCVTRCHICTLESLTW